MTFHKYFYSLSESDRSDFARRCETSVGYLSLIASGHRRAGETLAMIIERESKRAVPVEVVRPDAPWYVVRNKKSPTPKRRKAA